MTPELLKARKDALKALKGELKPYEYSIAIKAIDVYLDWVEFHYDKEKILV